MKYLVTLFVSFAGVFFSWFALWYFSLGGYQKAEHWLRDVYKVKIHSAEKIGRKKIIVASGSNSLFGISSEVIAKETGYPIINMSGHAGLTFNFLADQIEQVASEGDIIIMPLEFVFYTRTDDLTDWQLNNMQSWGYEHLKTYGVFELFKYFKSTDLSSYLERSFGEGSIEYLGVENVKNYCLTDESKSPRWQGYNYKSMNCFGDILVDRKAIQKILDFRNERTRNYLTSSDISDEFYKDAKRFSNKLNAMGAKLYFTWPATIRNESFNLHKSGKSREMVSALNSNLIDRGFEVICDPAESNLEVEYFFNTDYHLNKKGAVLRSIRLSDCINLNILDKPKVEQSADLRAEQYLLTGSQLFATRVSHLKMLKDALGKYKLKYGQYPKSHLWDGLHTNWGQSKVDWIEGLVPDFIEALPRDPRNNTNGSQQYIYRSNGLDFKILAHGVREDCPVIKLKYSELIDPVRNCNAYGFWSDGAEKW
ncbi:hypothetical protein CBR65_04800 [Cellvibrio sp. PSBB006]|nr:hypothetical protein CBR65_04800 [Cellvibrio sp. PSBB006]